MSSHGDFDLDQTAGGLWRCVHVNTRIAGVGGTSEDAKAQCLANMRIAAAGAYSVQRENDGVPDPVQPNDTTPIVTPVDPNADTLVNGETDKDG